MRSRGTPVYLTRARYLFMQRAVNRAMADLLKTFWACRFISRRTGKTAGSLSVSEWINSIFVSN